ncbi:MAG: DUF3570 domain-containing protein, partial [Myxococcota bacterium]|jgi:hypothetical protein|nr:DUF3570 domain-containing protein [Myxococcota bacterium]
MQLIALIATALAGGDVSTRVDVYSDGYVEVVMPAASADFRRGRFSGRGAYTADVLSGATTVIEADAISSATTWDETRHQVDLSAEVGAESAVGGGYTLTREPDYRAHTGTAALRQELFESMSTLSLSYGLTLGSGGRAGLEHTWERTIDQQVDASWSQILGRGTVGELLLTGSTARCGEQRGCLSNPYRFVLIENEAGEAIAVLERNPSALSRGAAAVRLAQVAWPGAAVHVGYRYYRDSWGIAGHTGDLSVRQQLLDDRLLLKASGRRADQGGASFVRDEYVADALSVPAYRSADREIAGLAHTLAAGRAEWSWYGLGPFVRLGVSARYSRLWFHYDLDGQRRNASLAGAGVTGEL